MSKTLDKEKLAENLHQQIDDASAKIDELKLKSHLAKADAKSSMDETIRSLEAKRDQLRNDLKHLKVSSETAWQDLAEGCNRSWNEFKEAVAKAVNDFK